MFSVMYRRIQHFFGFSATGRNVNPKQSTELENKLQHSLTNVPKHVNKDEEQAQNLLNPWASLVDFYENKLNEEPNFNTEF